MAANPGPVSDYRSHRMTRRPDVDAIRDEAWRSATNIKERHYTVESLESGIVSLAQRVYDLSDWIRALEARNALLNDVAHRAWHILDDGGEGPDDPDDFIGSLGTANRLSAALDALEATGWVACPQEDDEVTASGAIVEDVNG